MDEKLKCVIKQWHLKANNDLLAIESLLGSASVVTDAVCFHSQQAVEKYLKSFLIAFQRPFRHTHNLTEILRSCIEVDSSFAELEYVVYLSHYAVELRYPDDFYVPDNDEANEAYEIALKVKEFVVEKLKPILG